MPVLVKRRRGLRSRGPTVAITAAWAGWLGCTATTGSGPEPAAEVPPDVAAEPSGGSPPEAPRADAPLELSVWLDAPGRVASVGGTTLVSVGSALLVERDGAIVQDGLVATVPSCNQAGDVVDVAGTWPTDAVMLRSSGRLYRWDSGRWTAIRATPGPGSQLATVAGRPVLASSGRGGLALRWFDGKIRRTPTPDPKCGTAIAELQGARGNEQGQLVVWGRGCSGESVLERFGADAARGEVTRWTEATISSVEFDRAGDVMVALAGADGEVVRGRGGAWQSLGRVPGRIEGLVDMGSDGVLALVRREVAGIVRVGDPASERSLPAGVGEPIALRRGHDGSLFVTTTTALLRSVAPSFAWTLAPVGCDVATVRGAARWAYRDRRPRGWTCPGGLFVVLGSSPDLAVPPASWRTLYEDMRAHVELGYEEARRRRGLPAPPQRPGAPMVPVVAYELGEVHYGFAVRANDEVTEYHLSAMNTAMTRLGLGSPRAICADPPSLPEAEIRRLAGLTNTSAE